MHHESWSAYQLTQFLGAVASLRRAEDLTGSAIERIAEAVDAEVGALVGGDGIVASVGFPFGEAPERELLTAMAAGSGPVTLPGLGGGQGLILPIDDALVTAAFLARIGDDVFTRDEVNLVGGMVRVLELVLGNVRAFEAEDTARASLQERQALLEKLALIERSISHRLPLTEVLDSITEGAAELFGADVVGLRLLDPERPDRLVLASSRGLAPEQVHALRFSSKHGSAGGQAFLQERLVIVDDYQSSHVGIAELRANALQSAMAVPVSEDGVVVGSLTVATREPGRRYTASEQEMLQALAEHASLALTDARTIEAMRTAEREKDAMVAEVLAGVAERERLEGQLRQVQKMQAVGQLAGGIAHDFNNLLTVILNYSELVETSLDEGDSLRDAVREIGCAAERAAALTRQLLTFSRKELIRPETVDLAHVVPDLIRLLSRTLRESIDLELDLEPQLSATTIDRSQLEQVVMNLAVNASDAMPHGGVLRIAARNRRLTETDAPPGLAPGDYIVLGVSDSGEGMTAEVAARAFEPFYTTKPRGSGTGLGLATVYGIVEQAGGHVSLCSAPGAGTTATVYLRATEPQSESPSASPSVSRPPADGVDVLVVEDEDSVRTLVERMLNRNGYRVLTAASAPEALDLIASGYDPEVVLTDVVMPKMSGCEFADRLAAGQTNAGVVFMSGYPNDVASEHGVVAFDARFLQKPFTETGLLEAIEQALGRASSRLSA